MGLSGGEQAQHAPDDSERSVPDRVTRRKVRGRRPFGAAPANRRPLPPWAGRRAVPRVYFDGVIQSVNDWSPNTNVPQFPDTDRSSNRFPGPKRSPTATL